MIRAFLRSRVALVFVALCLLQLSLGLARPAAAATLRCCLDDWQGGGVCPAGKKLFAFCSAGCENCGTFTCVPSTTSCLR